MEALQCISTFTNTMRRSLGEPEAADAECAEPHDGGSVKPWSKRGLNQTPTSGSTITEMDEQGLSVAPRDVAAQYSTTCGCLARDFIPIKFRSWKGRSNDPFTVLEHIKEHCWSKLKDFSLFIEGTDLTKTRRKALKIMDTSWKWKKVCSE